LIVGFNYLFIQAPPCGTLNGCRQSGQCAVAVGWTLRQWSHKHWRQNVCRQGSVFGSSRVSRQIGHSVRSRSRLFKLGSAPSSDIVYIADAKIKGKVMRSS